MYGLIFYAIYGAVFFVKVFTLLLYRTDKYLYINKVHGFRGKRSEERTKERSERVKVCGQRKRKRKG